MPEENSLIVQPGKVPEIIGLPSAEIENGRANRDWATPKKSAKFPECLSGKPRSIVMIGSIVFR